MGKISVIIPVKDTGIYLEECLSSVINQSYSNLEIIIIDDNSKDNSKQIINEFMERDSRIKMYRNEMTRGVAASRNIGLQKSTGQYVYFLDSDDFLDQHILEILITYGEEFKVVAGKNVSVHTERKEELNLSNIHMTRYKGKLVKLFKNRSILNKLIDSKIIKENNLIFNESERYFTDLSMISDIISLVDQIAYCRDAYYHKRKRPDPIKDPALMQEDMEGKIKGLASIIIGEKKKEELTTKARKFLDNQFLNYYRKSIVQYFKEESRINKVFPNLIQVTMKLEDDALNNKSYVLKREIRAILNGNLNKYKKVMRQHTKLRTLKRGLKNKLSFYFYLYNNFLIRCKIDEKLIVFESFLGKNYSDSPKYIYEYMINNQYDYRYVWIFNKTGKTIPGHAKQVKRFSLKYFYYLAKAKYWVSNARAPQRLSKREENTYLQTWHGTPLKKLGVDIDDVKMPGTTTGRYKVNFTKEASKWDYLVSPNQYSTEIFKQAFMFDGEFLEYGYPRNDILYNNNNERVISKLKQKLNLPKDKKVILYAPTWRDDEFFEKGRYKFQIKLDLDQLEEKISDDYVIVLRMHYLIANELNISDYKDFIFDYSTYDDISELYLVSDILITDYSSVFFDYANLKRPILFYTYDLEKYRDTLRGFYIDIEKDVPGPLLFNTTEIIQSIINIEQVQKQYSDKYEVFYNRFCKWEDGRAASKVVKHVFKS